MVVVAASLRFSGLSQFTLIDDLESESQQISLLTSSEKQFSFLYIDHKPNDLSGAAHQGVRISDIPDNLSAELTPQLATYQASSSIDSISYTGIDGDQRQATHVLDLPAEFEIEFGDVTTWSASSPISSIHAQLTDSTNPVTMGGIVPEQTVEMTVILGEPYQFNAEAMDAESPNMQFYWDFDAETDSDDDGITDNDVDASGAKVIQDFQIRGTIQVICTVVNDAGVSTQVTYYVTVRSLADDDSGITPMVIALLAVILVLLLVGGVGMISWRRMSNARLEALLAEQAEAEEEEPRELSVEEQKAMFGAGSVTICLGTS